MTADLERVQAVFLAAAEEVSGAARAAVLDRECGGDEELRHQVEELLKAHDAPGSFLDRPALGSAPTENELPSADEDATQAPCTESIGAVIGNYKLLEQIGEGGFGVVFLAEQTRPVHRKVALKVLKPGMDTRQVVTRFEAERQALAIMDHPNIAKVHDGGATPSGRPYFVMELVKGVPITEFCDDNHLTLPQRLELFVAVCQAVQHAHQKGIIHRDLKPSNILVTMHDTRPVPKIIDFGIAKALGQELTDKTLFTGFAQMIGTPLYMSPEQAGQSGLDIDTRSDIYSLGVLLYELLTGTTPFEKERFKQAAHDEIRRIIREEEPPRPSTRLSELGKSGEANGTGSARHGGTTSSLASVSALRQTEPAKLTKLMRRELDWIVMKALDKDRNRRYETANGFAMDIQRYLADEPVAACPPSAWYRLRKFARRNKVALAMVASIALALLAGVVLSTWQAVRASRAEQDALANFDRAREAVKRMLTRVAQEELVDVPWMEPVRKALLQDALEFYEQLLAERTADPEVRLGTAQARLLSGWISGRIGEPGKQEAIQGALDLLEPLIKEFPDDVRYRAALATALHYQSHETAWMPQRYKEAEQLLRRAVKLQESVVSATPDSAENAYDLANMLHLLGNALRTGSRHEEAETVYLRVVSIGESVTAKDPDDSAHLRAQIRGLTCIAEMICQTEPDRAETLLLRAQKLATRFQAARRKTGILFDTAASTVADVDQALGRLYRQTKRFQEAEAACRRALAVNAKYASDFPSFRFYRDRLAWSTESLANSLSDVANHGDAERVWREAIDIFDKLVADFPTVLLYRMGLARSQRALAGVLDAAKRPEEAEKALGQARVHFVKAVEHDPGDIGARMAAARVSRQLAERARRAEDAERLYREALTYLQGVFGEQPEVPEHRATLADTYGRLATLFGDAGKFPEAEAFLRQSIAVFEKLAGEFPKKPEYRKTLATTYEWRWVKIATAAARPGDADKAKRQALAIWQKLAADFPDEPLFWHKVGVLQQIFRQHDDALASLGKAVELQPDGWESWHWRGMALSSLGQWEKAIADQTRVLALKPDHPWSWHQRGVGHSRLGQFDKALADFSKAIELKPDLWMAYDERGVVHGRLGQWDKGIADETTALKLNPKHWWSWWRRGDGYSALKQWDKAVADYGKAIEHGATNVQVWLSKATGHAHLDQPEQAVAELRQAVAKGFRDVKQLKNRGDWAALRSRDDFQQLVAELETKKK